MMMRLDKFFVEEMQKNGFDVDFKRLKQIYLDSRNRHSDDIEKGKVRALNERLKYEMSMGLFEDYYDEHDLDKNSEYSHMSKKELVIEAEYLHNSLWNILKYVDNGGTDMDVVKAEVYDGIYESRI